MQTLRSVFTFLLAGYLSACSSSGDKKKDPLLTEAAWYHNEATQIQAVLEPNIDRIDSLKTVLVNRAAPDAAARTATLDSVKTAFAEWEANLVEVPGMPHHHAHGEHHEHHNDATLKDLPAGQMRDLQRETLSSIRQLQTRFDAVAPK